MTWTQLWIAVFGFALAIAAAADALVLLRAARRVSREADAAAARRKAAGGLSVSDDTGLYPPYREWRSRTQPMLTPDDPDQP